jgi:hypothetical protein
VIEEACVVELTNQIAAADDPDIALPCGQRVVVDRTHVALNEPDVRTYDRWQVGAVRENPGRSVAVELAPPVHVCV